MHAELLRDDVIARIAFAAIVATVKAQPHQHEPMADANARVVGDAAQPVETLKSRRVERHGMYSLANGPLTETGSASTHDSLADDLCTHSGTPPWPGRRLPLLLSLYANRMKTASGFACEGQWPSCVIEWAITTWAGVKSPEELAA